MEAMLKELIEGMNGLKETVAKIHSTVQHVEQRLDRLEMMDSIEHRVTVNQIDLSDIKEIVERVASFQRDEILDLSNYVKNNLKNQNLNEELHLIHKRLDVQLNKIAKNEEAILIVGGRN